MVDFHILVMGLDVLLLFVDVTGNAHRKTWNLCPRWFLLRPGFRICRNYAICGLSS